MASIRLAAITDEISQEFEHALDVMLEYGARGAELRGLWGTNIAELSDDQVRRAVQALKDREMTAVSIASPFYKCDLFPASSSDAIEKKMHLAAEKDLSRQNEILERCIQLAHTFGAPFIRVFSFWRKEALSPEIEDRIVELFDGPVQVAEREGVTLILENEHACFLGTGAETARVVSRVDSPWLRVCWDPGNSFFAGEIPYPNGYAEVKPWLAHVHVKDAKLIDSGQGTQPEWTVVGEGEIDYAGQIAGLRADDYDGYVSLETHYVPPGGTPEEGSRLCLAGLNRLLA